MTSPNQVVTKREDLTITGVVFREFTGKLVHMEFPMESGRAKSKLQFTEVDIIKTLAPYPHPACEIVMNRTGAKGEKPSDRSVWGRLLISCDEQGYPDIMELEGKVLHMIAAENTIEANAERGTDAGTFISWGILSVDGVDSRSTPEDGVAPTVAEEPADPK